MVALAVIVLDKHLDLMFQVSGQEVVSQQDAVLQGLVPAFDLSLCLGMEGSTTHMVHLFYLDVIRQLTCEA